MSYTLDSNILLRSIEEDHPQHDEALDVINNLIYKEWRRLVTQYAVLGKNSHDARLAAAVGAHGITCIVTFNKDHFKRFTTITTLLPSDV